MAKKCLVYFFQGGRGGSLGSENVRLSMFTIVNHNEVTAHMHETNTLY